MSFTPKDILEKSNLKAIENFKLSKDEAIQLVITPTSRIPGVTASNKKDIYFKKEFTYQMNLISILIT